MFETLIRAAEGYCELGMLDDALAQLGELTPDQQERLEAIRLRIDILLRKQEWQPALELSLRMCVLYKKENYGFIHAAFCLHEMGRTHDAKQTLLDGPAALLEEAVYYYNLACYEAELGNLEQAKAYLRSSFQLDRSLRDLAKNDPDLTLIRDAV
jgi:predicted Zn-dependent protease